MATVFGISLGNSNCCIAVNNKGNVNVVANDCGERFTPSIVAFTDGAIHTGPAAKQGLVRNSTSTFGGMLHLLNGDTQAEFIFPLGLKCKTTGEKHKYKYFQQDSDGNSKTTKPEECIRHLLAMLKGIASSHASNGEIPVVLSVPSWTNGKLSAEITDKASSAGFKVLSIIQQTTAACIGYRLLEDNCNHMNILSLHCGGSSVIATLGEIIGGMLSIKDTSSTSAVAGDTVTLAVVNHLAKEFYQKYKGDPLENKRSMRKLFAASESCKHVLTSLNTAQIDIESLWEGVDFSTNLSRARFNVLSSSAILEFLSPAKNILSRNGLNASEIHKVVLSGGSCKIPKLKELLVNMFPDAEIVNNISPDEVTAIGAAIEAEYCLESKLTYSSSPLLSVLSVPIYICSGQLNELVFPVGSPCHYRQSVQIKNAKTAIIYESLKKVASPSDEQILAEIDFNVLQENCRSVQIEFAIKTDGSILVKMQELTSKIVKTFTIGNETC